MTGGPPTEARHSAAFPSTLWTEIISLRDPASPEYRARMNRLIQNYWRPVHQAVRLGWTRNEEEARDLTQEFFVSILEGKVVDTVDPARGSFRTYLRIALRHFLTDRKRSTQALKRGGGQADLHLPFDAEPLTPGPATPSGSPESEFDRAWATELLADGVAELEQRLRAQQRNMEADIFLAYDTPEGDPPTYRALADRFGVSEAQLWRHLEAARRELRSILLEKVKEYVRDESELFREFEGLFSS